MDSDMRVGREGGERFAEVVERVESCLANMTGLPLGLSANVDNRELCGAFGELLHRDLGDGRRAEALVNPCFYASGEMAADYFNTDASESRASFVNLRVAFGDQDQRRVEANDCASP